MHATVPLELLELDEEELLEEDELLDEELLDEELLDVELLEELLDDDGSPLFWPPQAMRLTTTAAR